jgi:hypothetical protein
LTTTGRWSATGTGGTADSTAAVDVLCVVVAASPVVPEPADGGCWPDAVEPAAPAAAALWSDLSVSFEGAGGAAFGAFAPRRALREDVLFVEEDLLFDEEADGEGADSVGALVFCGGAGATPLSCGTGAGAAVAGFESCDVPAAGGFAVAGFGAGGAADDEVWSVTPGVTGGAFWSCAAE